MAMVGCRKPVLRVFPGIVVKFRLEYFINSKGAFLNKIIVQELCESRGVRPGLSVLTSLLVSVDIKNY